MKLLFGSSIIGYVRVIRWTSHERVQEQHLSEADEAEEIFRGFQNRKVGKLNFKTRSFLAFQKCRCMGMKAFCAQFSRFSSIEGRKEPNGWWMQSNNNSVAGYSLVNQRIAGWKSRPFSVRSTSSFMVHFPAMYSFQRLRSPGGCILSSWDEGLVQDCYPKKGPWNLGCTRPLYIVGVSG